MRQLHIVVAIVFAGIGIAIFADSEGEKRTPALISLLISNVSVASLGVGSALERHGRPEGYVSHGS